MANNNEDNEDNAVSNTAKAHRVQRKWSKEEEKAVLNYLVDVIKNGKLIEKPTISQFYETMLKKLTIKCTWNQLNKKVNHLKSAYTKAIEWRNRTGQGVLIESGAETLKESLLKMCPYFDELNEIYGTKANIHPPFVHTTDIVNQEYAPPQDEELLNIPENVQIQQEKSSTSAQKRPKVTEKNDEGNQRKRNPSGANSGIQALVDAREKKVEMDNKKLEFEKEKFDFEKEKWAREMKLREREMELKHELEMAKLNKM